MPTLGDVEAALERLYLAAGTSLRREDQKKAREVEALLGELGRVERGGIWVDAAAGNGYVGVLAVELLDVPSVILLESEPARVERCRAIARASRGELDVRAGDVADPALWPAHVDVVVALHACGSASDRILERAIAARARWLFLMPCCYGRNIPFEPKARAHADRLGIVRQSEVRRRFVQSVIDSERTLRLEAAGYEVTVIPFVPQSVSGHNLLFRARRANEPNRMAKAVAELERMRARQ